MNAKRASALTALNHVNIINSATNFEPLLGVRRPVDEQGARLRLCLGGMGAPVPFLSSPSVPCDGR